MSEYKRIIVVDDNIENLTAIKNTLKEKYEVFPCPSAVNLFDLLEHIKPDLILLDVEMPDINGYEAASKLKNNEIFKDIPIMFLTSMNDAESEMTGLNLGAIDYIHKPFAAPLLLQRIKTHLSLIEHQLEAQEASRAKGEFLSHMSHEIRTPLNAIIGMINMSLNTGDIDKIQNCLQRAHNASKHLLSIINDILDMSKIEAQKFELSNGEFDFEKTLMYILNVTNVRAEEKEINLSVNINKDVPPYIIGDELRLSQVIINLVTNAIKFTPKKGKVSLNAEKLDESNGEITLKIEVTDSGIGITEEQQKKLFTSYNQADSSISKNFGGTGLGLAISKDIVKLMQGKIWIESEINKGSKFIFTIKVQKGTGDSIKKDSSFPDSKINFKDHTILIAEDVEINRDILAALLEKTEISTDFAENGVVALSMFKANPAKYHLILMDVNMPGMNGYEATKEIRLFEEELSKNALENTGTTENNSCNNKNLRKQIPIIAMSANVFKEDIEKCLKSGMNSHIGKPIEPESLYEALRRNLPTL
jgi:two-component system, sensor histidine kinase and response regulator